VRDKAEESKQRQDQILYEKKMQELEDAESNRRRVEGKARRANDKLQLVRKAEEEHKEEIRQMHHRLDERVRTRMGEKAWQQMLEKEERDIKAQQKKRFMEQQNRAMEYRVAEMEAEIESNNQRMEELKQHKKKMMHDRQQFKAVTMHNRHALINRLHDIKVSNKFEELAEVAASTVSALPPISPVQSVEPLRRSKSEASKSSPTPLGIVHASTSVEVSEHGVPMGRLGPPSRGARAGTSLD